jgi:hypothetical protein
MLNVYGLYVLINYKNKILIKMNDNSDYHITLEDNLELRKAVAKLEDALMKKHHEYENMQKIYEGLKELNEKTRKECRDINDKYLLIYEERRRSEKQHEMEKLSLKNVSITNIEL